MGTEDLPNLVQQDCAHYPDPVTAEKHAAGYLTNPAFNETYKDIAAFNFANVREAILQNHCETFPLGYELAPATIEELPQPPQSNYPWAFSDAGIACSSCHMAMNMQATLFFQYDENGMFTTDVNRTTRSPEDRFVPLTSIFLGPGGVNDIGFPVESAESQQVGQPRFLNVNVNSVNDYAEIIADHPKYAQCQTRRYVNWFERNPAMKPLSKGKEAYIDLFESLDFNVKAFLTEVALGELLN